MLCKKSKLPSRGWLQGELLGPEFLWVRSPGCGSVGLESRFLLLSSEPMGSFSLPPLCSKSVFICWQKGSFCTFFMYILYILWGWGLLGLGVGSKSRLDSVLLSPGDRGGLWGL